MSYFAKVNSDNIVAQIIVATDKEWCDTNLGGTWVETFYEGSIRKNFGNIGYTYDSVRDAFIPPKANCHPEETLDEATCLWICSNSEHEVAN